MEQERAEFAALCRQRAERARYAVERAARCYSLVEPENRLVARQLERDWEGKLLEQHRVEEEIARLESGQPRALTSLERAAIHRLAQERAQAPLAQLHSAISPLMRRLSRQAGTSGRLRFIDPYDLK